MHPWFAGLVVGWLSALAVGAVGVFVAYRRMLRLQDRAKSAERLAELGTLTGGLAHEIKNPLSTVQLNLQLLREDLPREDRAYTRLANRLGTAERETARLRDILDDFLRYAGRIELDCKPVELNRMCEDLVDFFMPQAQLQKVQLRLRRSPDDVVVRVDERLIKQAVLNLMLNGVQAMPNGGELILSVGSAGAEATVDVIDTGTGIPKQALDKIFQAYYSKKIGGTGLGLAMTRRIIDEHHGRVTVDSEEGRGTRFTLHLPRG